MGQATTVMRSAPSGDAVRLRLSDETELTWRVLGTLNLFRLVVPVVLLALFFAGADARIFGERYPSLFSATAAGYMVFAAVCWLAIRQRWVPAVPLAIAQIIVDIAAVVTLMHASGGLGSGLGGLLIVFVGAGSLVLPAPAAGAFRGACDARNPRRTALLQMAGASESRQLSRRRACWGRSSWPLSLAAKPLARRIQVSEELARAARRRPRESFGA